MGNVTLNVFQRPYFFSCSQEGLTALMIAVRNGSVAVVDILLSGEDHTHVDIQEKVYVYIHATQPNFPCLLVFLVQ